MWNKLKRESKKMMRLNFRPLVLLKLGIALTVQCTNALIDPDTFDEQCRSCMDNHGYLNTFAWSESLFCTNELCLPNVATCYTSQEQCNNGTLVYTLDERCSELATLAIPNSTDSPCEVCTAISIAGSTCVWRWSSGTEGDCLSNTILSVSDYPYVIAPNPEECSPPIPTAAPSGAPTAPSAAPTSSPTEDGCASNPCMNGGTCNQLLNPVVMDDGIVDELIPTDYSGPDIRWWSCTCPTGVSGLQCEVTNAPTHVPTSSAPSFHPTQTPTLQPSLSPSQTPSITPTVSPSFTPTARPTQFPSEAPTTSHPSASPTYSPTIDPTISVPTRNPSSIPSQSPSSLPTQSPSKRPTTGPTANPTTSNPTQLPTHAPSTTRPTPAPTDNPSMAPTMSPITTTATTTMTTTPFKFIDGEVDAQVDEENDLISGNQWYYIIAAAVVLVLLLGVLMYRSTRTKSAPLATPPPNSSNGGIRQSRITTNDYFAPEDVIWA